MREDETHSHSTRNSLIFRPPLFRNKIGIAFIKKTGIDIWTKCMDRNKGTRPSSRNVTKHLIIKDVMRRYMEYALP